MTFARPIVVHQEDQHARQFTRPAEHKTFVSFNPLRRWIEVDLGADDDGRTLGKWVGFNDSVDVVARDRVVFFEPFGDR